VFQPAESSYWEGNLKKYKWTVSNGQGEIRGANNTNAIDPSTGYFRDGARSFWSATADGRDVTKGGAREQVPAQRRLFYTTQAGGALSLLNWDSTSTPTNQQMGLEEDDMTARAAVLQRLQTMWGDPLHSVTEAVCYRDEDHNNNGALIRTNGGRLPGFDATT